IVVEVAPGVDDREAREASVDAQKKQVPIRAIEAAVDDRVGKAPAFWKTCAHDFREVVRVKLNQVSNDGLVDSNGGRSSDLHVGIVQDPATAVRSRSPWPRRVVDLA